MTTEEAIRILGLNDRTTKDDIQRAFHRCALSCHPDRFQTFSRKAWATHEFLRASEARDILVARFEGSAKTTEEISRVPNEESIPNATANSPGHQSHSLFEWLLEKFPDEDRPFGFVLGLLLIPVFLVFFYYMMLAAMLQSLMEKFGLEPFPSSASRSGRLAFLLSSTIAALAYLPLFYWFFLLGELNEVLAGARIWVGIGLSSMVLLFVLSEWIGFVLSEVWRRRIRFDIQNL